MDLILASTSRYRRTLLERLGLPFRCLAPEVVEDELKRSLGALPPQILAARLAEAKATSLAAIEPNATLIGSDQLVAFEGRILGKPGDLASAERQLGELVGKSHELITALAVWHDGKIEAHTDVARLHMRPLTPEEIARYVAADRPDDCAGAYKLESRGIVLFEGIEARDHSAITGLPLIALTTILRGLGYPIP